MVKKNDLLLVGGLKFFAERVFIFLYDDATKKGCLGLHSFAEN